MADLQNRVTDAWLFERKINPNHSNFHLHSRSQKIGQAHNHVIFSLTELALTLTSLKWWSKEVSNYLAKLPSKLPMVAPKLN